MAGSHVVQIADASDPRVADYVGLREATLRRRAGNEIFIAEGELVIQRALAAGYRPKSFLLAPRWVQSLEPWCRSHTDAPVFVAPAAVVEELTGFHVHRGALAAMYRGGDTSIDQLLRDSQRVVVVQDLVDHANLGAIARTVAALGWDGLIVSQRSADPLYRRSVKASMGVVLQLPWARLSDDDDLWPLLRQTDYVTVAMALGPAAVDLDEVAPRLRETPKLALLLGSEGPGLADEWIQQADMAVRIAMHHGVDSLNVSAAAAIACHSLRAVDGPTD